MQKHFLPLLLALVLLLAGCSQPNQTQETDMDAAGILQVMTEAASEETEDAEWFTAVDDIDSYLENYYGLPGLHWYDAAIVRLSGARAFELAVIQLSDDDIDMVTGQLQEYLLNRQGDFTGYAPDQAKLVENAVILTKNQCVALIISEDPDAVRTAFESCFGSGANAVGVPGMLQSEVLPNGRIPYADPGIDNMTIYDTSAILAAWDSGDPSGLSDYDRTIYDRAARVLGEILTDHMSDYEKEEAIYLWVVSHVSYDYDHYDSTVTLSPDSSTPYNPLVKGKGICLGFSVTFQLLMDMADVECITVVGASFSSREDHAWNMVRLNGEWYCVDATWDTGLVDPEWWNYFNVTSDYMADTDHQWDYSSVPEATATDSGRP